MNSPTSTPVAAPAIETRAQLDLLLENIAALRREREELWQTQEAELNAVRGRYRAQLTAMQDLLAQETAWAESWARRHRRELGPDNTLAGVHATLGFRAELPRIERASRRWTWSRIAATLAALPWGPEYLRTPESVVDQEALVADLGKLSREELRAAGMIVAEGEQFFLTIHSEAGAASTVPAEPAWQEAA